MSLTISVCTTAYYIFFKFHEFMRQNWKLKNLIGIFKVEGSIKHNIKNLIY